MVFIAARTWNPLLLKVQSILRSSFYRRILPILIVFISRRLRQGSNHLRIVTTRRHSDILSNDNFDFIIASAWLLGKDINSIFSKELQDTVINVILSEEKSGDVKLAFDLSVGNINDDESYQYNFKIINNLSNGIKGEAPIF